MRILSRPLSKWELGILLLAVLLKMYVVHHRGIFWTADATSYDSAALTFATQGTLLAPSLAESFNMSPALRKATPRLLPLNDFAIGFSVFIAAFYKFFPERHAVMIAMLFLAFLGASMVPIASREIFLRLFRKKTEFPWHTVVLASVALWPGSFEMSHYYLSENLTVILLTLWCLGSVLLIQVQPNKFRWHLVWALFSGLLFLTRIEYGPPILFVYLFVYGEQLRAVWGTGAFKRRLTRVSVSGLVLFSFFISPTIRNYYHFGEFIPSTAGGSFALWHAYLQSGDADLTKKYRDILERAYVPGKPGATDKNLTRATMERILHDPARYFEGMVTRIYRIHFHGFGEPPLLGHGMYNLLRRIAVRGSHVAAVFLFLFGLIWCWTPAMIPIAAVYLTKFWFIHTIYHFEPRMFYAFVPTVCALAAMGLFTLLQSRKSAHKNSIQPKPWSEVAEPRRKRRA